ncbi:MAG TPA: dihydroneopterin aldolase [Anaerolineaceae bacterium]|jgi:FolB domain-containing protein|nr:dihydroneopterin aldolase [Anaerolineaceae bacterium]NMD27832.1 dihydroneopterin aldolase [Chloroflexota bacterium]HOA21028.1 dihydroneopterin aldolase [Anaerolineaceae bacterium]HOG76799.1 dihydroneopterin aldolase [Anaerolineaceae bacterium]
MDKIIITDLLTTGIIGVKHPERDKPQVLLINLTLYRDLRLAGASDSITDTINYSTIATIVSEQVSNTQFHTVEALAAHLADYLLGNSPLEAVRIRVEKPKKVSNTARVGVEIFRRKTSA